jgi:hypothetical protein
MARQGSPLIERANKNVTIKMPNKTGIADKRRLTRNRDIYGNFVEKREEKAMTIV